MEISSRFMLISLRPYYFGLIVFATCFSLLTMKVIQISTMSRSAMINITTDIQKAVSEMKVMDGVVTVFSPHTTAGVTINESADPDVRHDILHNLSELVPKETPYFKHVEGNSDAHIKTSLVGSSVQVIVKDGLLQLGMWQAIYFCEFDGSREREVWVQ